MVAGIGQCIASRFVSGRVLLAGDACHTHSSGSAQGLNTGTFDATNLAWKLALVIKGQAKLELLDSYDSERRALVQQVIDNDRIIATLISGKLPPKFAGRTESPRDLLTEWFNNADNVAVSSRRLPQLRLGFARAHSLLAFPRHSSPSAPELPTVRPVFHRFVESSSD